MLDAVVRGGLTHPRRSTAAPAAEAGLEARGQHAGAPPRDCWEPAPAAGRGPEPAPVAGEGSAQDAGLVMLASRGFAWKHLPDVVPASHPCGGAWARINERCAELGHQRVMAARRTGGLSASGLPSAVGACQRPYLRGSTFSFQKRKAVHPPLIHFPAPLLFSLFLGSSPPLLFSPPLYSSAPPVLWESPGQAPHHCFRDTKLSFVGRQAMMYTYDVADDFAMEHLFRVIDEDKDGKIAFEELARLVSRIRGLEGRDCLVATLWKIYNMRENAFVSYKVP
ncbi:hypothetical protein CYMTET_36503 [Cymbomonas tetramitiformis]|uniref:EF-hand domain-containing protein n=1 Tax=Cymbomonas tetramitiformis TaxID=36881 RepID=A0AAE0CFU9_9CHLO|nr:hypothetical protein CYMTET_36503 [Cymbomonas tetramitiformis]